MPHGTAQPVRYMKNCEKPGRANLIGPAQIDLRSVIFLANILLIGNFCRIVQVVQDHRKNISVVCGEEQLYCSDASLDLVSFEKKHLWIV